MTDIRDRAERIAREPVLMKDLALAFDESTAATAAVHVGGKEFFPRILDDLRSATSSIHINQYGFRPGAMGEQFATVLLAKAAEGVKVRIVLDGWGSRPNSGSAKAYFDRLRAAGAEIRVVHSASLRMPRGIGRFDHRKLYVVDGRTGWVGGAGVEDHFEDGRFHDLFVRLTGPVVAQMQLVYLATCRWLGAEIAADELDALFPEPETSADMVPATMLHNGPGAYRPITTAIGELLEQATETLDVINPYVSDKAMIDRIEAAAKRGVRVRLFVPAKPNNKPCGFAQRAHHQALLDAGVQIYAHPVMLHAKAFVRDGEHVLAGTCNLEAWGLKRFFEIDVAVQSRALAAQFEERFAVPAMADSTPGEAPHGAGLAVSKVFALLSPIL